MRVKRSDVMARKARGRQRKEAESFDIVIAGAGYVGLVTAVAIAASRPSLSVAILDAAPPDAWKKDGRASAIAAAARRMLQQLDCWQVLAAEAQPIHEMVITDSRTADPVRPVFLTFDGSVEGEPFAHMVMNRDLNGTLRARAAALSVRFREGMSVNGFEPEDSHVTVHTSQGPMEARLLVAADGVRSRLREIAGIRTLSWTYGQSGIVCTVEHERPHEGRAEEHFLPSGPFATLPLKGNRSSIVWTERTEDAERLVRQNPLVFEVELERRFGLRLGTLHVLDKPRAWPLGLTLARDFVRPRFALAGDAAHGIHPIAGQGLNLGFKDAAALAEVVVEADRLGQDIGAIDTLQDYERWRRFDTVQMGAMTDMLNRLFSNDVTPLRLIRDLGLGIVDRLPTLKSFFIRQAAGLTDSAPRLLRGEPI
jgi:2-octaprenyl-6-methoxyphenol hydroxylase